MTRAHLRRLGKIWQLNSNLDDTRERLFEGTRRECHRWLRQQGMLRSYRRGLIKMGKTITP